MDATGTRALGNRWCGVAVGESFNRIGGTLPGERHVISGNDRTGISIETAERNLILGSYIGTDIGGTVALSNRWSGIEVIGAEHNVIQDNLLSGNEIGGTWLGSGSTLNHLRANRIGVAADGVSPLPNGSDGVSIPAASNTAGGPYPEDGNVIAFNANVGVQVWTHPGNTIRRNSIHGNAYAGIFLADGGNNSLSAPVITDVLPTSVSGTATAQYGTRDEMSARR